MFPADQLAIPDKKHLDHGFPVILVQRYDILVLARAVRHLLFLGNLPDTVVQIPVARSSLKIQGFCRRLHL